jgi:UDP-3-O-[3-hydroxymyristoyl] glucosamine N-acyltransferase
MTGRATSRSAQEIAGFVQARLVGDGAVELSGIASIRSAVRGDLVFVEDERNLDLALQSAASAVIAGEFAAARASSKPLLMVAQPKLAFARAAQLLCPRKGRKAGVDPSAVIHPSARVGENVTIDERVVIGEGAQVGD